MRKASKMVGNDEKTQEELRGGEVRWSATAIPVEEDETFRNWKIFLKIKKKKWEKVWKNRQKRTFCQFSNKNFFGKIKF